MTLRARLSEPSGRKSLVVFHGEKVKCSPCSWSKASSSFGLESEGDPRAPERIAFHPTQPNNLRWASCFFRRDPAAASEGRTQNPRSASRHDPLRGSLGNRR